jgi:hypothetical protein
MPGDLPAERQLRCARLEASREVRRDAAGDDQPDAAARPRRVERRELREAFRRFLEPGASKCGYGFIAARFYDSFTPAFET